jgi:hypothetical protein
MYFAIIKFSSLGVFCEKSNNMLQHFIHWGYKIFQLYNATGLICQMLSVVRFWLQIMYIKHGIQYYSKRSDRHKP